MNHSGNPAIALPLKGIEPDDGPPPSIQLVAPWWQENLLIGVSSSLEAHGLVGFTPPPIYFGEI